MGANPVIIKTEFKFKRRYHFRIKDLHLKTGQIFVVEPSSDGDQKMVYFCTGKTMYLIHVGEL